MTEHFTSSAGQRSVSRTLPFDAIFILRGRETRGALWSEGWPCTAAMVNDFDAVRWLPSASRPRTATVCGPTARPENNAGLEQAANAPPSSEHW